MRTPDPLPHPAGRVTEPRGEGTREVVLDEARVERPVLEDGTVNNRIGGVGVVVRVEDEQRVGAEELPLDVTVEAGVVELAAPLQRVVEHQQVEDQHASE